jgi:hypothetical protein
MQGKTLVDWRGQGDAGEVVVVVEVELVLGQQ